MSELWDLVWGKPAIDAAQLAAAIEREAGREDLDYRTRVLIRDASRALEEYWGGERHRRWLGRMATQCDPRAIGIATSGPAGFPYIRERLMERTTPDTIRQFLRDLGSRIPQNVQIVIGGSGSLILQGYLNRATQDIDLVDEVPGELRGEHALLEQFRQRYSLALTHFQSHFLPLGWKNRLHTLGSFGKIQASVVDVYDLFLGKLFSPRDKDLDDLRHLLPQVEREVVVRRLGDSCGAFLGDPTLRTHAERNWYVLTGDALPVDRTDD